MNDIFHGILRKFVLVFFDNIPVYSPTWCDHLHHLEVVLWILKRENFCAKLSKIAYLSHTSPGPGGAMDEVTIKAVIN